MDDLPELIPVREEDRFDEARLHRWLQGRLPGAEGPMEVLQFTGGHANLTYLLRFQTEQGPVEYVLRRPPHGPVPPGAHDMAREYRVLSTLWRAFPLAPRAYVFGDDPDLIGAPFFIMERRKGIVVRRVVPEVFGGGKDPVANRKLSEVVVDTLADLHAVDPEEAGLGDLGHPEGFLERQVEGWIRRWERAKLEDVPVADEVAAWLRAHMPRRDEVTILHNDWRLDNMAVAEDDPGRAVAVYDWDMATRGDPLADLGTLMSTWYDPGEAPAELAPMPTGTPGFMHRAEAIARYGERSGRDLSEVDWYVVFGSFKMAVIVQQIYFRWVKGQTTDPRFEAMGPAAVHLFRLAADRRPAG